MKSMNQFMDALKRLSVQVSEVDYDRRGYHLEVSMADNQVREFAKAMLDNEFYLVFVTANHVKPAIEVVYQFAHFSTPCRVCARVCVAEGEKISTISDIFHGADWHERETKDFFGVNFEGHPNLEPLLLAEDDADLKPLLKSEEMLKNVEEIRWQEEKPAKPAAASKQAEQKAEQS